MDRLEFLNSAKTRDEIRRSEYGAGHPKVFERGPRYCTKSAAEESVERLKLKPGFRDAPDGFTIDLYRLDEDHWTEGYVKVSPVAASSPLAGFASLLSNM